MPNPICPEHGTEMKVSKFGGFYCGKKNGEEYCKRKSDRANGQTPMKTGADLLLEQSGWVPDTREARVTAALEFAGRIYQGTAGESEQAALLLVERALLMFEVKP